MIASSLPLHPAIRSPVASSVGFATTVPPVQGLSIFKGPIAPTQGTGSDLVRRILRHHPRFITELHESLPRWVVVMELNASFRVHYPPRMEDQMEKNTENEMETGGILGFKGLSLGYYIGETILIIVYTHYGKVI